MAYLWMTVTNDEKELPVYTADTAKELAEILGISVTSVRQREENTRKQTTRKNTEKVIKVKI